MQHCPTTPRRKLLVAVRHCCRRAFEAYKQCALQVNLFLPEEKILHFRKLSSGPFFWMNGVENYQKANQNLFHMDGVLYLIELFSKIADRLVFCMFDIKLLIFTQSQDILLIFSQRQKNCLGQIQIKYILKFAI